MATVDQPLQRVLAFIEAHLFEPVDLKILARAAGLSPWHFHRVFAATVGETPAGYLRRRRFSDICRRLARTTDPLVTIALDAGFESQATFTRAFTAFVGVPPGRFRREQLAGDGLFYPPFDLVSAWQHERSISMTPRIEEHPSFQIVGVPGRFTPATNTAQIPALWARFVPLMDTVAHRKGTLTFGVCLPSETAASGDDVDFTYVAAVEVDPLAEVPPEMYGGTIPGGTFAIFTHTGHISRIGETVRYVFGEWTPNNPEWEHRAAPDFERYDERFDPSTGAGAVDIFVPVRRRPR